MGQALLVIDHRADGGEPRALPKTFSILIVAG
jgi:hypothetical protein